MEDKTNSTIPDLARALVAAFADIENVTRNADNPFFKSSYADLGAVLDSVRPAWSKHGLSVLQVPGLIVEVCGAPVMTLSSVVMHSSGQHMMFNSQIPLAPQVDKKSGDKSYTPQAAGSALTYLRRYALAAIAGIAQVDDDGNEASNRGGGNTKAKEPDASPDEIIQRIEVSETYDDVVKLESYVKETGDDKVVQAFIAKRRELKAKKTAGK